MLFASLIQTLFEGHLRQRALLVVPLRGTRLAFAISTKPSWNLYRLCVNGGSGYHDSRAKQTRHMQKSQVA